MRNDFSPCMCGDTDCISCGFGQGTREEVSRVFTRIDGSVTREQARLSRMGEKDKGRVPAGLVCSARLGSVEKLY